MVALQIINKILSDKNIEIYTDNNLDKDYFVGYENEIEFITNHHAEYNQVPDVISFVENFPDFEILEVTESSEYLIKKIREEYLYYKSVGVIQEAATLLKTDANSAVEYLNNSIRTLELNINNNGIDIIQNADSRLNLYQERLNSKEKWYIGTGFSELDTILNGWTKGEEFVVLFARTGQGKSWILAKTLTNAWQTGNRVGYISPEMSPEKIGYRIDTLINHFSNSNLVYGRLEPEYNDYIQDLKKNDNPFIVATPLDFSKRITISKLRSFCQKHKLDILGIDGITYMTDERYKKGDNKTITLTNISEDLSLLSLELKIPIIVVVQSNRGGVKNDDDAGTPELENIRDSDGIAQNATKVLSIRQTGAGLEFGIKKHRDGAMGNKVIYYWDIDRGEFKYIPSTDDGVNKEHKEEVIKTVKKSYNDKIEVF